MYEVRLSSAAAADALPGHGGGKRPRDAAADPSMPELGNQGGMLQLSLTYTPGRCRTCSISIMGCCIGSLVGSAQAATPLS